MPDAYRLHDARFLQVLSVGSAANALNVTVGLVPAGKVWTVLSARIAVSVAETRSFWFSIYKLGSPFFPVTMPVALLVDPALSKDFPMLTEGMEMKLYPGDGLTGFRDAATAGSTMVTSIRFIETDLPYYSHEEPLREVVKQSQLHGSVYRSTGGVSVGGGGGGGGHLPAEGGGGEPQPY